MAQVVGSNQPVNLTTSSHCRTSPKFSFGSGTRGEKDYAPWKKEVGPGKYKPELVPTERTKHVRDPVPCIAPLSEKSKREYAKSPGPGSYQLPGSLGSSASFGFGSAKRFAEKNKRSMSTPAELGPGMYEIRGSAGEDDPRFSMISRQPVKEPAWVLGPCKHDPDHFKVMKASGRVVIGKSPRDPEANKPVEKRQIVPGPGTYPFQTTIQTNRGFTMPSGRGLEKKDKNAMDPGFICAPSTLG